MPNRSIGSDKVKSPKILHNSSSTKSSNTAGKQTTYVKDYSFGDDPPVDTYTGTLEDGKPNGYGSVLNKDGYRYEGEWLNGVFHGQGKFYWPDGTRYEGEFKNGKFHGQGKEFNPKSQLDREGVWENGEFRNEQP